MSRHLTAPDTQWKFKFGTSVAGWLRCRLIAQERPARLAFTSKSLGVISRGQAGESEYLLSPASTSSTVVTYRGNTRFSLFNPFYWGVRASRLNSRLTRTLQSWAAWAESYDGPIPAPLDATRAVLHERKARHSTTPTVAPFRHHRGDACCADPARGLVGGTRGMASTAVVSRKTSQLGVHAA